jgi:hypothetical protein
VDPFTTLQLQSTVDTLISFHCLNLSRPVCLSDVSRCMYPTTQLYCRLLSYRGSAACNLCHSQTNLT